MTLLQIRTTLPLDRFDLDIDLTASRPVTGLFGASGAGKTSVLEAVAGLRRGARGRIVFDGEIWLDSDLGVRLAPERRQIGYVPQEGLLFPHLGVRHNLLAGARRAQENAPDLDTVARILELEGLLDRSTSSLSGGERQRVALGRALCSGPRLLLLDEPLASLDLPLRRRLLPLLGRVRFELQIPMLLVSHDPIEVQALCDEVIVLSAGRVLATGDPAKVLADPAIFPLAELEGFVNVLRGTVTGQVSGGALIHLDGAAGEPIELAAVAPQAPVGADVLLVLPATQIVLATERPRGLSARNILAATVDEITTGSGGTFVRVQLDPAIAPLTVEVTESTPATLGLATGKKIYAVIKATSCRVHGTESRAG